MLKLNKKNNDNNKMLLTVGDFICNLNNAKINYSVYWRESVEILLQKKEQRNHANTSPIRIINQSSLE